MWNNKLTYKVVIETANTKSIIDEFVADNFDDAYTKAKILLSECAHPLRITSLIQSGKITVFK